MCWTDYPFLDEVTMGRFIDCATDLVDFDLNKKKLLDMKTEDVPAI